MVDLPKQAFSYMYSASVCHAGISAIEKQYYYYYCKYLVQTFNFQNGASCHHGFGPLAKDAIIFRGA